MFRELILAALLLPDGAGAAASSPPPDLDTLLAEAEARNPALLAARARAAAASRVGPRVSALPDPWLTLGFVNESFDEWTVGDVDMSGVYAEWAQEIPWKGKRPLMARMAEEEAGAEARRAAAAVLMVRAQVRSAHADLYRLDRTREILLESRVLLRGFEDTARSLYETGQGMLENALRAQTEISRLDAELHRNAAERAAASAMLNALAGRDPGAPLGAVTTLPAAAPPGSVEDLEARLLAGSPEIGAMERMAASASTAVELAERERRPDLMLMGGYEYRESLDPLIEASVGFRLPAWAKRKQALAVAEASDREAAARAGLDAMRLEMRARLREEVASVERAERLLSLYDGGILAQARAALDAASASYSTGVLEFNALMDDFLSYMNYRVDRVAEEAARARAIARIESLVGGAR